MKTIIVGFDRIQNPTRCTILAECDAASARDRYAEMRDRGDGLDGLPIVEIWNSDRGFIKRYIAAEPAPDEQPTKKTKR